MPVRDERSLIEVGGERRSLAITLPNGWVRFWDMKKGVKASVYYDSILVILPPGHPKRRRLEKSIRKVLIELR